MRYVIAASMLRIDKQSLVKRVADLEAAMDQQVNKIKVHVCISNNIKENIKIVIPKQIIIIITTVSMIAS